jgi:hypothetical protein
MVLSLVLPPLRLHPHTHTTTRSFCTVHNDVINKYRSSNCPLAPSSREFFSFLFVLIFFLLRVEFLFFFFSLPGIELVVDFLVFVCWGNFISRFPLERDGDGA